MCLLLTGMSGAAQEMQDARVLRRDSQPLVNQAGYNLGKAKRFTCPRAADGTSYRIVRVPADLAFRKTAAASIE
jgi:hypothetical protein